MHIPSATRASSLTLVSRRRRDTFPKVSQGRTPRPRHHCTHTSWYTALRLPDTRPSEGSLKGRSDVATSAGTSRSLMDGATPGASRRQPSGPLRRLAQPHPRRRADWRAASSRTPPAKPADPSFPQEATCRADRTPHSSTSKSRSPDRGEGRAPGGCPRRLPRHSEVLSMTQTRNHFARTTRSAQANSPRPSPFSSKPVSRLWSGDRPAALNR